MIKKKILTKFECKFFVNSHIQAYKSTTSAVGIRVARAEMECIMPGFFLLFLSEG